MKFLPIKTRRLRPPQDDLYKTLDYHLPRLRERDIVVVTSKVISIHQGRCLTETETSNKKKLWIAEADLYLNGQTLGRPDRVLTIRDRILDHLSGIDQSNGNGYYILRPRNVDAETKKIYQFLKKRDKLKNLAVIVIDSYSPMLRAGTLSASLSFHGLEPFIDYRGSRDIFGRKLKVTRKNIVDSLAGVAGLVMGEGSEQTPVLIIRDVKSIKFTDKTLLKKLFPKFENDYFYDLLRKFKSKKLTKPRKNRKT